LQDQSLEISVIPTCADLARFTPAKQRSVSEFVLGHAGTVSGWYLFPQTLKLFAHLQSRILTAQLHILNRNEHEFIERAVAESGLPRDLIRVRAATPNDMPDYIRNMSCGTAIIQQTYGKIGSAPTRLAEYLGCGVPCVGNTGVGDMEEILEQDRVGVVLTDFSDQDMALTANRLVNLLEDPYLPRRCRATAERLFSLEMGAEKYDAIYRRLVSAA
jgi:glycosyltransferase involved in cell wall biosynthesis